jgi:hypothetical protein
MRIAYMVLFVGELLIGVLGFLMFCYPRAWQKMNARLAHKKLSEFDSPKQLAHTKQFGILLLILAAFSSFSLFALKLLGLLK